MKDFILPFSRIFVILVFLGMIPIIIGALFGIAFTAFVLYNAVLFVLLIIDYILTPNTRLLEIERVCDEKFSLGTENEVVFKVRNNSNYPLIIELKDEVPLFFDIIESSVWIKVLPYMEKEGVYRIIPVKRGEFKFGKVHFRFNGILKLCSKKATVDIERAYKVYPNLKDLSKYRLAVIKKSELLSGTRKTKAFGMGTEFESLREYSEGDDYRKVNWMATAKMNKLIVNTYEPEKNQHVVIMLDSSRVMNSEINFIKKLDYAINSSFLLSETVIRNNDNMGLMVFDSEVKRYIKPGKGEGQISLIAENLYNVEENLVTADYKNALMHLSEIQKRRSLLCIFTELFNIDEAYSLIYALKGLARNHVPLVITIKDTRIYEAANEASKELFDVFKKSAALKLVDEREKIRKLFADSGIAAIDIEPDKLSVEIVNKYLSMKSAMLI